MRRRSTNFGLRILTAGLCVLALMGHSLAATETKRQVMVRDLTTISGVRENPLIGYGVVVGLKRTGDSQQT